MMLKSHLLMGKTFLMEQKKCTTRLLIDWAKYIGNLFQEKMGIEIDYKEHPDYISISCEYMTFLMDTDEIFGMDVIKEVFSFEANISIRVQIFGKKFQKGIEVLFMLLKLIME